ncbi:MAG: PorV/PorQ family protein [Elusimicrobia bacterium]|nr:PorV/PorQ family protein [Elusimicrobiota bacterium]
MTRAPILAALALGAVSAAGAVETASFLSVGVGARYLAMGGAGTALAGGANALYWNPAGLSALDKSEATASHAELAQSVRHDFLAYARPTQAGTFAAGLTYLSQAALEGRDAQGHPTGGFQASDAALSLGWGRRTGLGDLGLTVKGIQSHIAAAQADTAALDAGLRRDLGALGPGRLLVAAALRDLGPGLKYGVQRNDLPTRLAFGAAYRLNGGHALAVEWTNSPRGAGNDFGLGGEYRALPGVRLRAGWTTAGGIAGGTGFDAARGLTLGVGLSRGAWRLDYAAVPMGELGSAHRFTLSARW